MQLTPDEATALEQVIQAMQSAGLLLSAVVRDMDALKIQIERAERGLRELRAERLDGAQ